MAALFAAAAVPAFAGASALPGRRNWWVGVGLVASGIALVKTGSTGALCSVDWRPWR